MKKLFKNNFKLIVGIVIGVIASCGIGYVVAENIAASNITYTNNNQSTVDGALDDLYDKAAFEDGAKRIERSWELAQGYTKVFWNDNFSGTWYNSTSVPSTTKTAYTQVSNYSTKPFIMTKKDVSGTIKGHAACIYYNSKVFCLEPNYWACTKNKRTDACGTATSKKLKTDMEAALGTTASSCSSITNSASCSFGSFYCDANSDGIVFCSGDDNSCYVDGIGDADCDW